MFSSRISRAAPFTTGYVYTTISNFFPTYNLTIDADKSIRHPGPFHRRLQMQHPPLVHPKLLLHALQTQHSRHNRPRHPPRLLGLCTVRTREILRSLHRPRHPIQRPASLRRRAGHQHPPRRSGRRRASRRHPAYQIRLCVSVSVTDGRAAPKGYVEGSPRLCPRAQN